MNCEKEVMASGGMRNLDTGDVSDLALGMADAVLRCREPLLDVLIQVATRESSKDEIARSISALAGATWEISRNQPNRISQVGVFAPSNNILYSYVLYGLIPSLYAGQVTLRPSTRVREVTSAVHEILYDALGGSVNRVHLSHATQRNFVEECRTADVIVFTGQYDNALHIASGLGVGPLFLLFGSGPNPLVAGPEADFQIAARTMLTARLYNSGQDCLCSDVMFVHRSMMEPVLGELKLLLDNVRVGDRREPGTLVAPLVYLDAFQSAQRFLEFRRDAVVYSGRDIGDEMYIAPTVLQFPEHEDFHPPELFSPLFCVVPYTDPDFIVEWAESDAERDRGMYMTVFGEPRLPRTCIGTSVVTVDASPLDLENGNQPFGGYGCQASAVWADGNMWGQPLLLSGAISRWQRGNEAADDISPNS
jgi:acyl-CoA reductase-like NAD-dependent aldehyde dehydrogenase